MQTVGVGGVFSWGGAEWAIGARKSNSKCREHRAQK